MHPALLALTPAERGLVLGLALAGARAGAAARVAGVRATACAQALATLGAAAPAARAAALDELAAAVRAPVPAGIDHVHPGWIRRLLEDEPPAVVRAVTAGLPPVVTRVAEEVLDGRDAEDTAAAGLRPGAVDELRRLLFGGLAPLPTAETASAARALCELPLPALLDAIDRKGAALLGVSLHGAPAATVARAAAQVGEPLGQAVVAAARAPAASAARVAARALVARVAPDAAAAGAARAVGLRAVADELGAEGPEAVAAVAQRLPPAVGDALLALAGVEVG